MAVPKQRHTKSRRNKRRGQIYIVAPTLTSCPKCKKETLPHTVCPNCGFYKGREVIDVLKSLDKKQRKLKEREIKENEKEQKGSGKSLNWEELSKK
ncbi:MAG: 50S ribosomal protein L32 [Candidatus Nealsonbacteria bacterium]